MGWLDLVVMVTVGRQGREAELAGKGCRAPPSSAGARGRQGARAGQSAGPGAGSFSQETHGRICLNAF